MIIENARKERVAMDVELELFLLLKMQFEIVLHFIVNNTGEQFMYYENETIKEKAESLFLPPVNPCCFYKIEKICSCKGHFLLFPRNFFSFIQSLGSWNYNTIIIIIIIIIIIVIVPCSNSSR